MSEVIKFAELKTVINSLSEHVVHHWENAQDRYYHHCIPEAILFSTIAFEELMKLSEYADQYDNRKGISSELYNKLLSHKYKLTAINRKYELLIEEKIKEKNENFKEKNGNLFLGLDFLKQIILYFDWFEGHEITINNYMNNKLTKNNIEHAALYFVEFVRFYYNVIREYHKDVFEPLPKKSHIMRENNPLNVVYGFHKRKNELAHSENMFILCLREFRELELDIRKKRKIAKSK